MLVRIPQSSFRSDRQGLLIDAERADSSAWESVSVRDTLLHLNDGLVHSLRFPHQLSKLCLAFVPSGILSRARLDAPNVTAGTSEALFLGPPAVSGKDFWQLRTPSIRSIQLCRRV